MSITHADLPTRLLPLVPPAGLCVLFVRKEGRKGGMGGTLYLAKGLWVTTCYRYRRGRWVLTHSY